jgi:hypothetical protein
VRFCHSYDTLFRVTKGMFTCCKLTLTLAFALYSPTIHLDYFDVEFCSDTVIGGGTPSVYYAIQVVDGKGALRKPAYDDFVKEQKGCFGPQSNAFASLGSGKGGKGSKGGGDAGFCQCAYTGDFRYGAGNLDPFIPDDLFKSGKNKKRQRGLVEDDNKRRGTRSVRGM